VVVVKVVVHWTRLGNARPNIRIARPNIPDLLTNGINRGSLAVGTIHVDRMHQFNSFHTARASTACVAHLANILPSYHHF
jgi:hypothetical protein